MTEIDKIKATLSAHGYKYERNIGHGSFSSVMLCKSQKYDQTFAIKRAVKDRLTVSEYDTLISLIHPNIIRLYDSFEDESAQYLVMEYCENGTIRQKGALPYDKFIYYAKPILEALAYCHSKKIAHRDIKPENIFIDKYDHVKLADFGFSKQFDVSQPKTKEKCGSLMYLAPEMLQSREICPFKADIWALGITFFVMATGNFPFTCNNVEDLKKLIFFSDLNFASYNVDARIKFLVNKMATVNLQNRPTAEKLLGLPMFQSSFPSKNILLSEKYRKHSFSNGYRTPFTLTTPNMTENHQFSSDVEDNSKRVPLSNILSYRGISMYPQVQRNNRRFQPLRPA